MRSENSSPDGPNRYNAKELRERMKGVMAEFAALEAVNEIEAELIADVEKDLRLKSLPWEYLCGIAEGVNRIVRMHPSAAQDLTLRCVARIVMIVTARLALEAISIHEYENEEFFPEELPIE